ncbi:MAG: hypothetical protein GY773_09845 [Actinomycetia bacterium]|nr:hypothetical protein [Actinomycetes bacterium]
MAGLFGSGGLSHEPGGERDFFIEEDFNRWFLGLLEHGDHDRLLDEVMPQQLEQTREGATGELLTWLVAFGRHQSQAGRRSGHIGPCPVAVDNLQPIWPTSPQLEPLWAMVTDWLGASRRLATSPVGWGRPHGSTRRTRG